MSDEPTSACACQEGGPRFPRAINERYIGRDETKGRFADVELIRCGLCRQLWIKYLIENEGFTNATRWGEAPIDEARAATITAEEAPGFIEEAPRAVLSGCGYLWAGEPRAGNIRWDL